MKQDIDKFLEILTERTLSGEYIWTKTRWTDFHKDFYNLQFGSEPYPNVQIVEHQIGKIWMYVKFNDSVKDDIDILDIPYRKQKEDLVNVIKESIRNKVLKESDEKFQKKKSMFRAFLESIL